MHAKQINQLLILIMLIISGLSIAATAYVVNNNYEVYWKNIIGDSNNVKLGTPLENCKSVADRLNMPVEITGEDLYIKRREINNPEMLFSKVSSMIMACTQYRLDTMCVGTECGGYQFSAKLAKIN